eukprot:TRINITY_DN5513_c2_g1_i3.p1 TRINITY_DN5513_c2_g1~~TRINITY_DN5513_c2_g1_i3.p1  ORF type:complete len:2110 (-),score=715.51 TRINITY_DN5513_c2_g1_i3:122-6451(-)
MGNSRATLVCRWHVWFVELFLLAGLLPDISAAVRIGVDEQAEEDSWEVRGSSSEVAAANPRAKASSASKLTASALQASRSQDVQAAESAAAGGGAGAATAELRAASAAASSSAAAEASMQASNLFQKEEAMTAPKQAGKASLEGCLSNMQGRLHETFGSIPCTKDGSAPKVIKHFESYRDMISQNAASLVQLEASVGRKKKQKKKSQHSLLQMRREHESTVTTCERCIAAVTDTLKASKDAQCSHLLNFFASALQLSFDESNLCASEALVEGESELAEQAPSTAGAAALGELSANPATAPTSVGALAQTVKRSDAVQLAMLLKQDKTLSDDAASGGANKKAQTGAGAVGATSGAAVVESDMENAIKQQDDAADEARKQADTAMKVAERAELEAAKAAELRLKRQEQQEQQQLLQRQAAHQKRLTKAVEDERHATQDVADLQKRLEDAKNKLQRAISDKKVEEAQGDTIAASEQEQKVRAAKAKEAAHKVSGKKHAMIKEAEKLLHDAASPESDEGGTDAAFELEVAKAGSEAGGGAGEGGEGAAQDQDAAEAQEAQSGLPEDTVGSQLVDQVSEESSERREMSKASLEDASAAASTGQAEEQAGRQWQAQGSWQYGAEVEEEQPSQQSDATARSSDYWQQPQQDQVEEVVQSTAAAAPAASAEKVAKPAAPAVATTRKAVDMVEQEKGSKTSADVVEADPSVIIPAPSTVDKTAMNLVTATEDELVQTASDSFASAGTSTGQESDEASQVAEASRKASSRNAAALVSSKEKAKRKEQLKAAGRRAVLAAVHAVDTIGEVESGAGGASGKQAADATAGVKAEKDAAASKQSQAKAQAAATAKTKTKVTAATTAAATVAGASKDVAAGGALKRAASGKKTASGGKAANKAAAGKAALSQKGEKKAAAAAAAATTAKATSQPAAKKAATAAAAAAVGRSAKAAAAKRAKAPASQPVAKAAAASQKATSGAAAVATAPATWPTDLRSAEELPWGAGGSLAQTLPKTAAASPLKSSHSLVESRLPDGSLLAAAGSDMADQVAAAVKEGDEALRLAASHAGEGAEEAAAADDPEADLAMAHAGLQGGADPFRALLHRSGATTPHESSSLLQIEDGHRLSPMEAAFFAGSEDADELEEEKDHDQDDKKKDDQEDDGEHHHPDPSKHSLFDTGVLDDWDSEKHEWRKHSYKDDDEEERGNGRHHSMFEDEEESGEDRHKREEDEDGDSSYSSSYEYHSNYDYGYQSYSDYGTTDPGKHSLREESSSEDYDSNSADSESDYDGGHEHKREKRHEEDDEDEEEGRFGHFDDIFKPHPLVFHHFVNGHVEERYEDSLLEQSSNVSTEVSGNASKIADPHGEAFEGDIMRPLDDDDDFGDETGHHGDGDAHNLDELIDGELHRGHEHGWGDGPGFTGSYAGNGHLMHEGSPYYGIDYSRVPDYTGDLMYGDGYTLGDRGNSYGGQYGGDHHQEMIRAFGGQLEPVPGLLEEEADVDSNETSAGKAATFDCAAGLSTWELGWSEGKKTWCCQHEQLGCPEAEQDGRLPPHTPPSLVDETSETGWMDNQYRHDTDHSRAFAVLHHRPNNFDDNHAFDCHQGLTDWQAAWSDWKKAWCCKQEFLGCDDALVQAYDYSDYTPPAAGTILLAPPGYYNSYADYDYSPVAVRVVAVNADYGAYDYGAYGYGDYPAVATVHAAAPGQPVDLYLDHHDDHVGDHDPHLKRVLIDPNHDHDDHNQHDARVIVAHDHLDTHHHDHHHHDHVAEAIVLFDCQEGLHNWMAEWSDGKKDYCCKTKHLGCKDHHHYDHVNFFDDQGESVHDPHVHDAFDCQEGLANFEVGWSWAKREWCCKNYHFGCKDDNHHGHDHDHDHDAAGHHIDAHDGAHEHDHPDGWHMGSMLDGPAAPRALGPHDCQAGLNNWVDGWSKAKKDWCCATFKLGCVRASMLQEGDESEELNEAEKETQRAIFAEGRLQRQVDRLSADVAGLQNATAGNATTGARSGVPSETPAARSTSAAAAKPPGASLLLDIGGGESEDVRASAETAASSGRKLFSEELTAAAAFERMAHEKHEDVDQLPSDPWHRVTKDILEDPTPSKRQPDAAEGGNLVHPLQTASRPSAAALRKP